MNTIGILHKDFVGTGHVKDVDMTGKRVSGYLSDFDTKDSHGDVILKGAYKKTLSERKDEIYFLNQHDWKQPHGFFDELYEDSKGLYFVSKPLVDTSYSMDTLKLYEAGIMTNHSIGYIPIKEEYDKKADVNYLKEIKLFEGSNVTIGSNRNTPFTGFKSNNPRELEDRLKVFMKAYRTGTFTDETFGLLEIAIRDLQKQAFDLAKKSLESQEGTQKSAADIINEFNSQRHGGKFN